MPFRRDVPDGTSRLPASPAAQAPTFPADVPRLPIAAAAGTMPFPAALG
jgi:hypothetical protein